MDGFEANDGWLWGAWLAMVYDQNLEWDAWNGGGEL